MKNALVVLLFVFGCSKKVVLTESQSSVYVYQPYQRNEESIKQYLAANKRKLDQIEGIWSYSTGKAAHLLKVAIVRRDSVATNEFIEIMLSDGANNYRKVIMKFTRVQNENVYLWNSPDPKVTSSLAVQFDPMASTITYKDLSFIKLYP